MRRTPGERTRSKTAARELDKYHRQGDRVTRLTGRNYEARQVRIAPAARFASLRMSPRCAFAIICDSYSIFALGSRPRMYCYRKRAEVAPVAPQFSRLAFFSVALYTAYRYFPVIVSSHLVNVIVVAPLRRKHLLRIYSNSNLREVSRATVPGAGTRNFYF